MAARRAWVVRGPDLTGLTFGRWRVLGRAEFNGRIWSWRCRCECGTEKNVLGQALKAGQSQSCGCLRTERVRAAIGKHGHSVFERGSLERSIYTIWQCMKQRCTCPTNPGFKAYGARGIKVHPAWIDDFAAFLRDVGPRPSFDHSLDRYPDKAGNYEPGNVRWATREQQNLNRRTSVVVTYQGTEHSLASLGRKVGIAASALKYRIFHKGMSVEDAVAAG